ncbi:class I SAM-dependent methyltransferase [Aquirhabdus parva]|nr:SAM-dependent methyltransferase [Aquirhabdus parva]
MPPMRMFRPEVFKAPRDFERPDYFERLSDDSSLKVALEIGAGVGLHALTFAAQNPEVHLFAIERTAEKYQKFEQSHTIQPLVNLTSIHADAIPWVIHAVPPRSLAQVFILYPNPEPKNAAQRWFNMPFMQFLLSRMQTGATLTLASNIEAYLDEAEEQLNTVWYLPYERTQVTTARRTHFEIKYMARGEPCGQLLVTKPENYQTPFDAWTM